MAMNGEWIRFLKTGGRGLFVYNIFIGRD